MPHPWWGAPAGTWSYPERVRGREVEVHRITTAAPAQTREQAARQRTYLILMGTRMVAIVVAVVVPGFWRWIAVVIGVAFPYLAVVLVNAVHGRGEGEESPFLFPDHKTPLDDQPYVHRGPRAEDLPGEEPH